MAPGTWISLCSPCHPHIHLTYQFCLPNFSQSCNHHQLLLPGFICPRRTTGAAGGDKLLCDFYILHLRGASIRKVMFHVPKSAPMKAAGETFELYANLSPPPFLKAILTFFFTLVSVQPHTTQAWLAGSSCCFIVGKS